ncbi:MAG: geranylgeranylglyceryl/heptaprenylglyceryl phosphate synthase [bacterium]|nr:geranylgeranylglyceryl/heptaprenylglyceryl phosphate synthase [bacterium]
MDNVWNYLEQRIREYGCGFLAIVDPDKYVLSDLSRLCRALRAANVDGVLVGGTILKKGHEHYGKIVLALRQGLPDAPVIIFPGGSGMYRSLVPGADAIFFRQLISGTNRKYLYTEQCLAGIRAKRMGIEAIAVGYVFVRSRAIQRAADITNTTPVREADTERAVGLAILSESTGKRLIWFERGSNAEAPVPEPFIKTVSAHPLVELPIMVSGGLRTAENVRAVVRAGARLTGVGTVIEQSKDIEATLSPLVSAAHWRASSA